MAAVERCRPITSGRQRPVGRLLEQVGGSVNIMHAGSVGTWPRTTRRRRRRRPPSCGSPARWCTRPAGAVALRAGAPRPEGGHALASPVQSSSVTLPSEHPSRGTASARSEPAEGIGRIQVPRMGCGPGVPAPPRERARKRVDGERPPRLVFALPWKPSPNVSPATAPSASWMPSAGPSGWPSGWRRSTSSAWRTAASRRPASSPPARTATPAPTSPTSSTPPPPRPTSRPSASSAATSPPPTTCGRLGHALRPAHRQSPSSPEARAATTRRSARRILAASPPPLAVYDVGDDDLQHILDHAFAREMPDAPPTSPPSAARSKSGTPIAASPTSPLSKTRTPPTTTTTAPARAGPRPPGGLLQGMRDAAAVPTGPRPRRRRRRAHPDAPAPQATSRPSSPAPRPSPTPTEQRPSRIHRRTRHPPAPRSRRPAGPPAAFGPGKTPVVPSRRRTSQPAPRAAASSEASAPSQTPEQMATDEALFRRTRQARVAAAQAAPLPKYHSIQAGRRRSVRAHAPGRDARAALRARRAWPRSWPRPLLRRPAGRTEDPAAS